jgi:hypothetical protein
MAEDAGRSTTEFLAVRDGSTCWLPVCWLPVSWLAVLDVLTVRDILIRLNKDDGLLLRWDAAEAAPSLEAEPGVAPLSSPPPKPTPVKRSEASAVALVAASDTLVRTVAAAAVALAFKSSKLLIPKFLDVA